jgi:hypothetical protein
MSTKKPAPKVKAKKATPKAPAQKVKAAPKAVVAPKLVAPLTPRERLVAIGMQAIIDHVASGESLLSWCKASGFAYMTVLDWIDADEDRAGNYARARDIRADVVFDQLDDLCDDATGADNAVKVAGLRLKADTIKWKLARMNSKKYGDKQETVHSGSIGVGQILESMDGESTGLPR